MACGCTVSISVAAFALFVLHAFYLSAHTLVFFRILDDDEFQELLAEARLQQFANRADLIILFITMVAWIGVKADEGSGRGLPFPAESGGRFVLYVFYCLFPWDPSVILAPPNVKRSAGSVRSLPRTPANRLEIKLSRLGMEAPYLHMRACLLSNVGLCLFTP